MRRGKRTAKSQRWITLSMNFSLFELSREYRILFVKLCIVFRKNLRMRNSQACLEGFCLSIDLKVCLFICFPFGIEYMYRCWDTQQIYENIGGWKR